MTAALRARARPRHNCGLRCIRPARSRPQEVTPGLVDQRSAGPPGLRAYGVSSSACPLGYKRLRPARSRMSTPRACAQEAAGASSNVVDPSSLASVATQGRFPLRVAHAEYALAPDFATGVIQGYAALTVVGGGDEGGAADDAAGAGFQSLHLDTRGLRVRGAHVLSGGASGDATAAADFTLGEADAALGALLTVRVPRGARGVGVRFETSAGCTAVQFLAPEQTAGGEHPYLFSQCQAIHARSLLPCQDAPSVKSTYAAVVLAPEPLTAVMSAVSVEEPRDYRVMVARARQRVPSGADTRGFAFEQKVPIPSYLIAVAVGNLVAREIGPRSKVWSEPEMVEAGEYEFQETEDYLAAGEAIAGPYVWGRYDLLLLPPSFPYGGMENPSLTFVTPTLLAGDRSLSNVIAHEVAHSWTGNLVGCRSWEHFWLNEGFTVFLERKILARAKGDQGLFDFKAIGGYADLKDCVKTLGAENPYTRLVLDLSGGDDPDDAYSRIAYEKGFSFLVYLERKAGGEAAFAPFLRAWLKDHAFSSVVSAQWKAAYTDAFPAASAEVDWEKWLYAPGLPPVFNEFDDSRRAQAAELAKRWHTADPLGCFDKAAYAERFSAEDIDGFSSDMLVAFLEALRDLRAMQALSLTACDALDAAYSLTGRQNGEIRLLWIKLRVNAGDEAAIKLAIAFVKEVGRMKYLRPTYKVLYNQGGTFREAALASFQEARASYHPIAQKMVAQDLGV